MPTRNPVDTVGISIRVASNSVQLTERRARLAKDKTMKKEDRYEKNKTHRKRTNKKVYLVEESNYAVEIYNDSEDPSENDSLSHQDIYRRSSLFSLRGRSVMLASE